MNLTGRQWCALIELLFEIICWQILLNPHSNLWGIPKLYNFSWTGNVENSAQLPNCNGWIASLASKSSFVESPSLELSFKLKLANFKQEKPLLHVHSHTMPLWRFRWILKQYSNYSLIGIHSECHDECFLYLQIIFTESKIKWVILSI